MTSLVKPSNKSVAKDNPDSIQYQESLRGIWRVACEFLAGGIYTTESTGHYWDGRYSVKERSR